MAVRQRGKSWQADFRWDGARIRDTHPTKDAAEKWISDSIAGLKDGTLVLNKGKVVPATPKTVAEAMVQDANTLEKLVKLTHETEWKGTSNEKKAHANAKRVAKFLGEKLDPMKAITGLRVREFVANLKSNGKAAATINRHLSALGKMIDVGVDSGMFCGEVKIPWQDEKGNARSYEFTREVEGKIIDQFEKMECTSMRDLYIVLVDSGLRLSEALGLTVQDVEKFEAGEGMRIWGSRRKSRKNAAANQRTKNAQSRTLPMTIRVADTLKTRKAAMPVGETRFFWDLNLDRAEKFWKQMRTNLGEQDNPEFVMHACRHTFASRLAKTGASSLELMLVGGWQTEAMVKRYAHLNPNHSKELVARLNPLDNAKSPANL